VTLPVWNKVRLGALAPRTAIRGNVSGMLVFALGLGNSNMFWEHHRSRDIGIYCIQIL
jgi:hypothetical protein